VKFLPNGEIGEIIVKGAVVTASYYGNSKATALAKISDGATGIWHRMGDMGYFDGEGRLWFCGRKSHVVKTREGFLYPVCCEAPFNILTKRRCALVAVGEAGDENPVLVVEGNFSDCEFRELTISLRECAMKNEETSRISRFVQLAKFPVDIRHNAKISREEIRDLLNSRM
jgi:acyl-CoA synthetase (AMP-forming)/AMP-acid ligase II